MDHDLAPSVSSVDEDPRPKRGRRIAQAMLSGPPVVYLFCASTRTGIIDMSPLDPTTAEEMMNDISDMGAPPPLPNPDTFANEWPSNKC